MLATAVMACDFEREKFMGLATDISSI